MRRGRVGVGRRGPGLMGTMARTAVVATTATVAVKATSGAMGGGSKKQAEAAQNQQIAELQAQQNAQTAQQQAAAQQAPAEGSLDDQLIQIQKLSAMKDQGVLTDEEFAAKKAQILGI